MVISKEEEVPEDREEYPGGFGTQDVAIVRQIVLEPAQYDRISILPKDTAMP